MKYILIMIICMFSCETINPILSVVNSQKAYLAKFDKELAYPYEQINICLSSVAAELESKITNNNAHFFEKDTIFILNSIDIESGRVIGQVWSNDEFYSFEIKSKRNNQGLELFYTKGESTYFKEIDSILDDCKTMRVRNYEMQPGGVDGGMYFIFSKKYDSKVESIAFEEW